MDLYSWIKAAHVAAALLFVGGTLATALVLTGLADAGGPAASGRLAAAAWRWSRFVTTPAMLAVWGFGLALAAEGGWFAEGWLRVKLVAVVALSGLHGVGSGLTRRVVEGEWRPPRAIARAPLVIAALVVAIALLAVGKPF